MIAILTFYQFVPISEIPTEIEHWRSWLAPLDVRGTVLVANEGINASLCGDADAIAAVDAQLDDDPRFANTFRQRHTCAVAPFKRLIVKARDEIVTFKQDDIDPLKRTGTYVDPDAWNALIDDPDVTVIDTRNRFEYNFGTFQGAIDPKTLRFSDFAEYVTANLDPQKHRKVAMFCTGGIRCEKATALMLQHGFEEVYHLRGGILRYLNEIPQAQSRWDGDCVVFDDRVAVNANLQPVPVDHCPHCYQPVPPGKACISCVS